MLPELLVARLYGRIALAFVLELLLQRRLSLTLVPAALLGVAGYREVLVLLFSFFAGGVDGRGLGLCEDVGRNLHLLSCEALAQLNVIRSIVILLLISQIDCIHFNVLGRQPFGKLSIHHDRLMRRSFSHRFVATSELFPKFALPVH